MPPTVEHLEYLVKTGVASNAINNYGHSALHLACECNGKLEIIKYLVEKCHHSVDLTDNDGATALHYACEDFGANDDLVIYLMQKCESMDTLVRRDAKNQSPLHHAATNGSLGLFYRMIRAAPVRAVSVIGKM